MISSDDPVRVFQRFAPLVAHYRESARRAGHDAATLPVGINSHGYVADTARQAAEAYYPRYAAMMSRIGRERGWPPMTREQYDMLCGPDGALFVGGPDEVAEKMLRQHALFGRHAARSGAAIDRTARHARRAHGARRARRRS